MLITIRRILIAMLSAVPVTALEPNTANAKDGDIFIEFIGTNRLPLVDEGQGLVHAFFCIKLELHAGLKEDCFGFYPAGAEIAKINLTDGITLSRISQSNWRESPQPYSFVQQTISCRKALLYDKSRDLYWDLPLDGGISRVRTGTLPWVDYKIVKSIKPSNPIKGFAADMGIISGPGDLCSEFNKAPGRFASPLESYQIKITSTQRQSVYQTLESWNNKEYDLTQSNCIDLIDNVALALNLKRPPRSPGQRPISYVTALKSLNH